VYREARDAAKHLNNDAQDSPHNKELLSQNISSAEINKFCPFLLDISESQAVSDFTLPCATEN